MEDSCSDSGDFTVDLTGRGMDVGTETDWGEDDSRMLCGSSTEEAARGSWFVWVREEGWSEPGSPAPSPLTHSVTFSSTLSLSGMAASDFDSESEVLLKETIAECHEDLEVGDACIGLRMEPV